MRALPRFENFYEVHFGAVLTTYLGPGGMGAGIQVLDTIPRGGDHQKGVQFKRKFEPFWIARYYQKGGRLYE